LLTNKKIVRKGNPLSHIFFNIVADVLVILIAQAKDSGLFIGLVPNLVDNGLSILQYADTILFMENDLEEAKNMKVLLCAFEQLSGLKINFHKSEMLCYGNVSLWKMIWKIPRI
jgi:sugar/nucleoside kinase (ribokinase family)